MKTIMNFLLLLIVAITVFCCSDSPTSPTISGGGLSSTILQTDSLGNILGGDSTDWCQNGNSCYTFYPAFPNPTTDVTHLYFNIHSNDTISLFAVNSQFDTVFVCNNQILSAGSYMMDVSGVEHNFHNVVKRFYFISKKSCGNSPDCKNYGDIQFN